MTCLDANYFLRALTEATTQNGRLQQRTAIQLFEAASRGEVETTATDVVLHEVLYVLTARTDKNGYGLTPADACARLRPLIDMPAFKHRQKRILLGALDVWTGYPQLGFSDSLTAALVLDQQIQLAAFDDDFDRFSDIDRYPPAA